VQFTRHLGLRGQVHVDRQRTEGGEATEDQDEPGTSGFEVA
jgi:hypothetical protein